jgi:hypothetical protein
MSTDLHYSLYAHFMLTSTFSTSMPVAIVVTYF